MDTLNNNFDPTAIGAVPVKKEFDPTTIGAVPVAKPTPEPGLFSKIGTGMQNIATGVAQSEIGLVKNLGQLGGSAINYALGKGFTPNAPGGLEYGPGGKFLTSPEFEKASSPSNLGEKIGFGGTELAQFLVPLGKAPQIAKATTLGLKTANVMAKSISQALDFGAKTFVQSGGNLEETKTSGILGAVTPPIEKAIQKAVPIIGNISASVLGNMIGKDPENIKIAFQNPFEVAKNISAGIIPLQVREKAVSALNSFDASVKETFKKGLQELQDKTPTRYVAGKYNAVKQIMQNELQNAMSGMPQTFRDFKVSVQNKGTSLNFDVMNSPIIKSGEKNNVKMAWQTILNQKDFSPKGVEATASRLYKLMDYGELKTETSALVSDMYSRYLKSVEKVYPKLAQLRTDYGTQQKIINGIDEVIKSSKNQIANPTAVTGAVNKLSNLFKEDGEAYLNAIKNLEQKTGVNLLKKLAASEFLHTTPASFGSRIAQAGLLIGVPWNPWILAALPLFSPRFVGRATTIAGMGAEKLAPTIKSVSPYIAPTVTSGVQQNQRGLLFGDQNQ